MGRARPQYGGIALLFYRVWRPVGDPSIFILPMLAGLLVGTLDEWLQWFVPARVGEMRPSYASPRGSRWPPDQRADAEQRIEGKAAPFLSNAEPLPILTWSKRVFWLVTGLAAFAIVLTSSRRTA